MSDQALYKVGDYVLPTTPYPANYRGKFEIVGVATRAGEEVTRYTAAYIGELMTATPAHSRFPHMFMEHEIRKA